MAKPNDPPWEREKMHPWWQRAASVAQLNGGFVVVKAGSPEFKDWLRHFRDYEHWTPRFMTEAAGTSKEVTLPTRWPPSHAKA